MASVTHYQHLFPLKKGWVSCFSINSFSCLVFRKSPNSYKYKCWLSLWPLNYVHNPMDMSKFPLLSSKVQLTKLTVLMVLCLAAPKAMNALLHLAAWHWLKRQRCWLKALRQSTVHCLGFNKLNEYSLRSVSCIETTVHCAVGDPPLSAAEKEKAQKLMKDYWNNHLGEAILVSVASSPICFATPNLWDLEHIRERIILEHIREHPTEINHQDLNIWPHS